MSFASDLGSNPFIIDDYNAKDFVEQITDSDTRFAGGYETRDYRKNGLGSYAPVFDGTVIRRTAWDDHIKRQEDEQSSPDHWRIAGQVPVLDQGSWGYCWCYGLVGAFMTSVAMTGVSPVERLSAMAVAYQVKRGRNQGGWAGEAIEGVDRFGLPTDAVWPNRKPDPRGDLARSEAVKRSAARGKLAEFEELPRSSFDHLASALLDPVNPRPVTLGLNWWGHLVYATKLVKIDRNRYGVKIVNSWRESWGDQGTAILTESKGTAYEQISIRRILARSE